MPFSYKARCSGKLWQKLLLFALSLFTAMISGGFLFRHTTFSQLTSVLISFGLDPARSQLLAALMMTMAAALPGAALGRYVSGALIGSSVIFWSDYLNGFIQLELLPVYDPGGHLEPLLSDMLLHTVMVMLAVAFLSAFFGALCGLALGKILLDPPYHLLRLLRSLWQSLSPYHHATRSHWPSPYHTTPPGKTQIILEEVLKWIKAALLILTLLLAAQAAPLFLFSPDVGIHIQPKVVTSSQTQSTLTTNHKGTLIENSLTSPTLTMQQRSMIVYLPPSYNTAAGQHKHYPVLYLLHGSPGGEHDWFTGGKASESADTLIEAGQIPEMILVAPDGNGRNSTNSEWGNSYDHKQLMETFVAVDVVRYIDQSYRTIPDPAHRAIGGLSMGAFGAMNIALHHPDVFKTVISLGGYYQAQGEIWGHNLASLQHNSPTVVLPHNTQAHTLHIYLGAASHDQPYYNDTKEFMQELDSLHIPYQFNLQNSYHSWNVWQIQMYHALLWITWK